MGVKVSDKAFQRAIERKPKQVQAAAKEAALKTAMRFAQRTQSMAPIEEGDLVQSIVIEEIPRGWRVLSLLAYAPFVEFGHQAFDGSFVPPSPYMRPAREASVATAKKNYQREISRALRKN